MLRIEHIRALHISDTPAGSWHRLLPAHHTGWIRLALPLLSALALVPWNAASVAMSIVAVAAFLAHEPAAVLLGRRGPQAFDELESIAWRMLVGLGVVAGCAGGVAASMAGPEATVGMAVPMGIGAVLAVLILQEKENTLAGQLWGAAMPASCALPVALAGDSSLMALAVSAFWALAFVGWSLGKRAGAGRPA